VFGPARACVPVFAGNNIGLAVAIDIGNGAAFVGAQIESVLFEGNVGGAGGGERGEGG